MARCGSAGDRQRAVETPPTPVEGLADRRIHLSARATGDEVNLAIRDHGPGVAPAIAGPDLRPVLHDKQLGSGLGLGLSISYNIMKDFEGDLRVSNHPEGGAVFRWCCAARGRGIGGRMKQTVLLIDDDEAMRRSTEQALELAGFSVQSFAGAEAALGFVGRGSPAR